MITYLAILFIPVLAYSKPLKINLPMQATLSYENKSAKGARHLHKGSVKISSSTKLNLKINKVLNIIDDGRSLWYYDIPLRQVTKYPHSALWSTLFWDVKKIKQKYTIKVTKNKNYKSYALTPKQTMEIKLLRIDITNSHNLISFSYVDGFDDMHSYKFSEIGHKMLPDSSYKLILPKNVDVINSINDA